jgi:hypothetical protein
LSVLLYTKTPCNPEFGAFGLRLVSSIPNFHGAEGAHAELPRISFQKSEALTLLPFLAPVEDLFYVFASFGDLRKFQEANPMRTHWKTSHRSSQPFLESFKPTLSVFNPRQVDLCVGYWNGDGAVPMGCD